MLAAHTSPEKSEEAIFDIVNQFNRGAALITSLQEKVQLAELNLIAGQRAKTSTAYRSALTYFSTRIELLGENLWKISHELTYRLNFARAECTFLSRNFAEALQLFDTLLTHATTTLEKADILRVVVDTHTTNVEIEEAIARGLGALRLFGIDMPRYPSREDVAREYAAIRNNLDGRPLEDLVDLALMTDPDVEAAMGILVILFAPAIASDRNLLLLCCCHLVNMTIRHGNCDASVMAYGYLGMNLGPFFGDYRRDFQFGRLGCDLVEKRQLVAYKAKIEFIIGAFISFWKEPRTRAIEHLSFAFKAADVAGDLSFASYACDHLVADAEANTAIRCETGVCLGQGGLRIHGTLHRIHRASELRKDTVARCVRYAAPVFPNEPVEYRASFGQPSERADLIGAHEAAVAVHICCEDCDEASADCHRV